MFYHIILTTKCNLKCEYCYGASCDDFVNELPENIDITYPENIDYNIQDLKRFCDKDPDCTLTFYGGEPLCNLNKIKEIMDKINPKQWMIQTNAIYLNKLPSRYTNKFHTILTSIDGDKELTNRYRGNTIYETVLKNIQYIKDNGYKGEIIARMAVMENTDIYKAVTHLINIGYTSIHWQLNAMFWENDLKKRNFIEWANNSYNPGIKKLIEFCINDMKQNNRVLKLYPFLDVTYDLLKNQTTRLRCGSGHSNYSIQTDGVIIPCPIMLGMKDYYLGHIKDTDPNSLKKVSCKEPCASCKEFETCGGRCLYSNILKPWKNEGYHILCPTIYNLIDELRKALPNIKELIQNNTISLKDFEHIKYNGCEIIP